MASAANAVMDEPTPSPADHVTMRGVMAIKRKGLRDTWRERGFLLRDRSKTLSHFSEAEVPMDIDAPPLGSATVLGVFDLPDRPGKRPHRMDAHVVDAADASAKRLLSFAVATAGEKRRWMAALSTAACRLPLTEHPSLGRLAKQLGPEAVAAAHEADDAAIKAAAEQAEQDEKEEQYYKSLALSRECAAALKAAAVPIWACWFCGNRRSRNKNRCMDCNKEPTTLEHVFVLAERACAEPPTAAAAAAAAVTAAELVAARRAFVTALRSVEGVPLQKLSQGRKIQHRELRLGGRAAVNDASGTAAAEALSVGGEAVDGPSVLDLGKRTIALASIVDVAPAATPLEAEGLSSSWMTLRYTGSQGGGEEGRGETAATELYLGLASAVVRDDAVQQLRALSPATRVKDEAGARFAQRLRALETALRRAKVGFWLEKQPDRLDAAAAKAVAKAKKIRAMEAAEAKKAREEAGEEEPEEEEDEPDEVVVPPPPPFAFSAKTEAMVPAGLFSGDCSADAALRTAVLRLMSAHASCDGPLRAGLERDSDTQVAVHDLLRAPAATSEDEGAMHADEIMQLHAVLENLQQQDPLAAACPWETVSSG